MLLLEADGGVPAGKDWPVLPEKGLSIAGAPLGDGPRRGESSHVKNCEKGGSLVQSSLHAVLGHLVGLKKLAAAAATKKRARAGCSS